MRWSTVLEKSAHIPITNRMLKTADPTIVPIPTSDEGGGHDPGPNLHFDFAFSYHHFFCNIANSARLPEMKLKLKGTQIRGTLFGFSPVLVCQFAASRRDGERVRSRVTISFISDFVQIKTLIQF